MTLEKVKEILLKNETILSYEKISQKTGYSCEELKEIYEEHTIPALQRGESPHKSKSGEKHITYNYNDTLRVTKPDGTTKSFKCAADAVAYRNEVWNT